MRNPSQKTRCSKDCAKTCIAHARSCWMVASAAGCPFGENCHFLHYVPGGYKSVAQMMNLAPPPATRAITGPPPTQNGSVPAAIRTRICNRYNTAEGYKFGTVATFLTESGSSANPSFHLKKMILMLLELFQAVALLEWNHQCWDLRQVSVWLPQPKSVSMRPLLVQ